MHARRSACALSLTRERRGALDGKRRSPTEADGKPGSLIVYQAPPAKKPPVEGAHVRVYWPGSKEWFSGRVMQTRTEGRMMRVEYDDGTGSPPAPRTPARPL